MTGSMIVCNSAAAGVRKQNCQTGFAITELLISTLILLVISSGIFGILSEIQRAASYQTEVQTVLNNTRIAMQTVERCLRQAGNDPHGTGLSGITIVNATEVRIQSDLTGSLGAGSPDKGDPDGDVNDSGENVTIRYNDKSRSLEIISSGGSAQVVAGNISGLSFQYYDAGGRIASAGSEVRKINVTISGTSLLPNPQTHRFFGVKLSSDVLILT